MKMSDLLKESSDEQYADFWHDEVIVDPEEEELDDIPSDPDKDDLPHILMQLKKAVDVDGNYPIKFKDGSEHKLDLDDIVAFVEMYMEVKPDAKELMQTKGAQSKENFDKIVEFYRDQVVSEESKTHGNSKIYDKCWTGYRKVPGKTRGETGSCEKI